MRKIWQTTWWTLLILAMSTVAVSAAASPSRQSRSLLHPPEVVTTATIRDAEFADLPHLVIPDECERTQLPRALATPNPLLGFTEPDARITVSFIVGTDGTVQSPLILEGTGSPEDESVLQTIRSWRYRPATCNGVPMEAEGRIEFSSR
ncbi:MAG TPA: energy transducer TonB [Terriglobales bacterium]|nr:energy transducer TonB [Terriglobales bacterium]